MPNFFRDVSHSEYFTNAKIHVILNINDNIDIRLLPIWLDYHKHLFDSGEVVFSLQESKEYFANTMQIVYRFFPEWKYTCLSDICDVLHYAECRDGNTSISHSLFSALRSTTEYITICLSCNEFLLIPSNSAFSQQDVSHIRRYTVEDARRFSCLATPCVPDTTNAFSSDNLRTPISRAKEFFANMIEWVATFSKDTFPNNIVVFFSNLSLSLENNLGTEIKLLLPSHPILPTRTWEEVAKYSGLEEEEIREFNKHSAGHQVVGVRGFYENIQEIVNQRLTELKTSDYIYHLDAYVYSNYDWGEDRIILREDINLLEDTDFNDDGHRTFSMNSYAGFLKTMVETRIEEIAKNAGHEALAYAKGVRGFNKRSGRENTSRKIDATKYHLHVTPEQHTQIINAMPWKKTESPEIFEFSEYMESRVSAIVGRRVKIFNDDIWVRICRPSTITEIDYNPCHRDIYLDFYRNTVNVYIPIVGSNEKSSLAMQTGSHFWNERDLVVTTGGAYFKNSNKKYSVDAILRSKQPLRMVRPNPQTDEFILFSPYLIHGCSSNDNTDTTRMSVEIRFIADDANAKVQEDAFNAFLIERVWR